MTALLLFSGTELFAQKPVVTAVVWDDRAKEGEDQGELRVYLLGEPVPGLRVKVGYEGTALNDFDYRSYSDVLEIDRYGKFVVRPILDDMVEGDESVELKILPDDAYEIDPEHAMASVLIQDGDIPKTTPLPGGRCIMRRWHSPCFPVQPWNQSLKGICICQS